MIEFEKAAKSFRTAPGPGRKARLIHAVRDLDLTIRRGEVVGIVGPNGAGKTTLFGLLLGFLEATQGSVRIDDLQPRAYVRKYGASYLPERFQLPRDWTVAAALHAIFQLDGANVAVDDVLAEYDLTSYAAAPVFTLSRGTMQRLGIAQAIAAPRALVVLDEPTEGLDPLWRVYLRERVQRLRAENRVILLASHDLVEIERLADRVVILANGAMSEIVELRRDARERREYTLVLAAAHDSVRLLFPDARSVGTATYTIAVDDVADLSTRIAALIEAGATLVSITPSADLEQRVARASRTEAT